MTKTAGSGSGSISQRHGSAEPDLTPHQNVMDREHWLELTLAIPERPCVFRRVADPNPTFYLKFGSRILLHFKAMRISDH
jgi:hypothetical protein